MPTYARADLAFVRGEGPYLFTEAGERYQYSAKVLPLRVTFFVIIA